MKKYLIRKYIVRCKNLKTFPRYPSLTWKQIKKCIDVEER